MIEEKHLVHILHDAQRRGMESMQLMTVLSALKNGREEISPETAGKIQQIIDGTYQEERNIAQEVKEWVERATGVFSLHDISRSLQLSTRKDNKNISIILKRMSDEYPPMIQRYGEKNATYKRLINTERIMDLTNVDMTPVQLSLPLGLHLKTRVFRKSIITIAGVTGKGKTMFALNVIRENMDKWDTYYLSSEMDEQAITYNLQSFYGPADQWKFTPITDIDDYALSTRPDGLNIIDYLQAPQSEFWRIRDRIEDIRKKLKNGVALILIQRKTNALWGEGAEFSAQASSLYINLDWGVAEVVKNRFRQADRFPGLDKRTFDIKGGLIVTTSGWFKGDPKEYKSKKEKKEYDPDFPPEE